MKVLVVNNAAPFIRGGAEELADHLVANLNATRGVESELLRIPFQWDPPERLIEQILLNRSLQLYNVDRVIALKFPAYLVPHRHKTLWLLHQFRQAYDLADAGQGLADEGSEGVVKRAIRIADNTAIADCQSVFTNSPVTQTRLATYNGISSEVLYPPLNGPGDFKDGGSEPYLFAGGRVGPGKRQHLLVEAMASVRSEGRLIIAGPPESKAYADTLRGLVDTLGLADRVELHFAFHPREKIANWVNQARACAYLPFDEDSLGYVTMEAFAASKAVLTTEDAGGLLEMVNDATGIVVAAHVEAIAEAMNRLLADKSYARRLGRGAKAAWTTRNLTWPRTIERLLS